MSIDLNPVFLDTVTGHISFGFQLDEPRDFLNAALIRIGAAAMEDAA